MARPVSSLEVLSTCEISSRSSEHYSNFAVNASLPLWFGDADPQKARYRMAGKNQSTSSNSRLYTQRPTSARHMAGRGLDTEKMALSAQRLYTITKKASPKVAS